MNESPEVPRIEIRENGPYLVRGISRIKLADGSEIDTESVFALCRCGHSANKPFCDATHKRIGFSGARETRRSMDEDESYPGRDLTILYRPGICAHAERCVKELPGVFGAGRRPWVDPDGAPPEEVAQLVARCPSGALAYAQGGVVHRDFEHAPAIDVEKGGPYRVQGGIRLQHDLQPPSRDRYVLCRCGASKNKPYCDGSHASTKFE